MSEPAAVRFGSRMHDLECYVDNSLLHDEAGAIVGRRGGVKAWDVWQLLISAHGKSPPA